MKLTKLAKLFIVPLLLGIACFSALSVTLSPSVYADPYDLGTSTVPGTTPDANGAGGNTSGNTGTGGGNTLDICSSNVPKEIQEANGCNDNLPRLKNVIISIVNGFIAITGVIAVIFIVVGGIGYMTSAGDPNKAAKARNTIMYACIGLAICACAYIIVDFVIVKLLYPGGGETGVEQVGSESDLQGIVTSILNGVIAVLGTVCVIYIIVGGVNYMSSQGEPQKIAKAKNTLLYAGIGLIICVLSYAIVNFLIINVMGGQDVAITSADTEEKCTKANGNWNPDNKEQPCTRKAE